MKHLPKFVAALLLALSFAHVHAADPITYLGSPVNITPTDDGTWRTADVSAHCTDGVTSGVLIRTRFSVATSNDVIGFRKTGSTDTYTAPHLASPAYTYTAIGVDANGQLDILIEDGGGGAGVNELLACFHSDHVVFFTNAITFAPGSINTWTDWNIAGNTGGDTATAAILYLHSVRVNTTEVGWRKNGSSEEIFGNQFAVAQGSFIGSTFVPVDASEILEVRFDSTSYGDFKIVGYTKGLSSTWVDPGVDLSLGATGAWTDLAAQAGCVMQVIDSVANAAGLQVGFRLNGDSSTVGYGVLEGERVTGLVRCDGSGISEGQIDNTGVDFYRRGYFTTEVAPPPGNLLLRRRRAANDDHFERPLKVVAGF